MQRVTNCILYNEKTKQVLLLKKPRRGWWVAPGGKMEPFETIEEAVIREYEEETGLKIHNPQLQGVFTMVVGERDADCQEWMMFTFLARHFSGELLQESPEGELAWVDISEALALPKAEGDQLYFTHILKQIETPHQQDEAILVKRFRYTPDYELLHID